MSKGRIKFGKIDTVFKGNFFSIVRRPVIFPNGKEEIHEYCERFDSVTILAFDNKNNLLLTREYRAEEKLVWFLPAGKRERSGSKKSAQRELREETGFRANKLKRVFKVPASSSYFLWDIYLYAGKDLVYDPLPAEEYFKIEVVPTPLKKALKMALDGTIQNQMLAFHILRFDYMLKNGQFQW